MDYVLSNISIHGEISNFKRHTSGHLYFTLKDKNSAISCIMFRSSVLSLTFEPRNGMSVIIKGSVSVYEKAGQYQIYVNKMEKEGRGVLYEAFEKLKKALKEEGLFEQEIKKPIPPFPKCIGVITSSTGAAIRDIIQVSTRRNPGINLAIYPAIVQGKEAAQSICDGIYAMNKWGQADILIVGRGGGSIEDLWAFNEGIVARAIHESEIPIISAVGHETDFTIADFVSDLRAPTPSAAAELAVPSKDEYLSRISHMSRNLNHYMRKRMDDGINRLQSIQKRTVFKKPMEFIYREQQTVDNLEKMLHNQIKDRFKTYSTHLIHQIKTLENLSPLKTLMRGYSITTDDSGYTISSVHDVKINDDIRIRVEDGIIHGSVHRIEKEGDDLNA